MVQVHATRIRIKNHIPGWIVSTLTAALLLTVSPCAWAGTVSAPRMVIDEPTFHFQEVDEGAVLEHDFIVKNLGKEPLEIKKVAPG